VPHWLWVKDSEGRYTMANRSYTDFLGVQTAEAIGERSRRFFPPAVAERFEALDREVLETGRMADVDDLAITMDDGRDLVLHAIKIPLLDEQGRIQGLLGIAEDVTEFRRAMQQRENYAQLLEQKNKELSEFASVASHDLQEPLRKMRAFSDLLLQDYGDQLAGGEGRRYLDYIQDAAERLQGMISGLLSLSRLTDQRAVSEPVALGEVLETVAADLSEFLRDAEAALEMDVPHVVRGDATQIYRLFKNLVANGVKYRSAAPPRIRVRSRTATPEERPPDVGAAAESLVVIDVTDNGIGFSENDAARIFGLFQRLHPSGDIAGQGIGLAECRRIVERHGGSISARGKLGEGAVFTVLLPAAGRPR
jgi:PAS domain S-box-containing protein